MSLINKGTTMIETDRLILNKYTQEDVDKIYEYDFRHLKGSDEENKIIKTPSSILKEWYGINPQEYFNDKTYDWCIYLKETNYPIGNILIDKNTNEDIGNVGEVAYNIHPDYWGQGFLPEALESALEFLFIEVGYDAIRCSYASYNDKSKRVTEKMNFIYESTAHEDYEYEGKMIDVVSTIMTKEMWLNKPKLRKK